jgi:hypothetical protein
VKDFEVGHWARRWIEDQNYYQCLRFCQRAIPNRNDKGGGRSFAFPYNHELELEHTRLRIDSVDFSL